MMKQMIAAVAAVLAGGLALAGDAVWRVATRAVQPSSADFRRIQEKTQDSRQELESAATISCFKEFQPKFLISIFHAVLYLTQRRGEAEVAEFIPIAWALVCFHQLGERFFRDSSCHGFLFR